MYSISSSIFSVLAIILIAFQSFGIIEGYAYPIVPFVILTLISIAFAVYYFVLEIKERK